MQDMLDGKDLSLLFMKENVYATVSKPGTVDEAVAYFLDELPQPKGSKASRLPRKLQ